MNRKPILHPLTRKTALVILLFAIVSLSVLLGTRSNSAESVRWKTKAPRSLLSPNPRAATERSELTKPEEATRARVEETYGKLPLSFETNQGQTDPQVKFLSRGNGYSLFLTPTEAVLALQKPARGKHAHPGLPPSQAFMTGERLAAQPLSTVASAASGSSSPASILRMKLVGSNASAKIAGADELPGKSNYFIGNDPSKWRTNVSNYRKVEYRDVYPGVDLIYYGNQRQLEHDFVVAPGADSKAITLARLST